MSSSGQTPRLHPASLARALDLWALRREKILALLDVRAAREARTLADACRTLSQTTDPGRDDAWQARWLAIRERALAMLANGGPHSAINRPSSVPVSSRTPTDAEWVRRKRASAETKPDMPRQNPENEPEEPAIDRERETG